MIDPIITAAKMLGMFFGLCYVISIIYILIELIKIYINDRRDKNGG